MIPKRKLLSLTENMLKMWYNDEKNGSHLKFDTSKKSFSNLENST